MAFLPGIADASGIFPIRNSKLIGLGLIPKREIP